MGRHFGPSGTQPTSSAPWWGSQAIFVAMGAALLLASCAVPVPPSGGPPDTQPPTVVSSDPPAGSTGVRPDRVRIVFNEYINERTAATALSVSPAQDRPPEIRASGRSIDVVFREPLRDNTTYIISLDTGLQDAHGVALGSPVTVAFATGDRINRGRMAGSAVRARDGKPDAGLDIYAWRRTGQDSLSSLPDTPPDYRTQTDASGQFGFDFLQETDYAVFGIRDANRNRRADPGEAIAWPPRLYITADSTSGAAGTWVSAVVDTTAPSVRRAVARSQRRIEIDFDETVFFRNRDPRLWTITDSSTTRGWDVLDVYQSAGQLRSVTLFSEALGGGSLYVSGSGLSDSTGNPVTISNFRLEGTARPDTVRTRFLGYRLDTLAVESPIPLLRPGRHPVLSFSAPPDSLALGLGVSLADTSGNPLEWTPRSANGTLVEVVYAGTLPVVLSTRLDRFSGPDSTATIRAQRVPAGQLGDISGQIVPAGKTIEVIARQVPPTSTAGTATGAAPTTPRQIRVLMTSADSLGQFRFVGLPAGDVLSIAAFRDDNGNGRWDFGTLNPFRRPEPTGYLAQSPAVRSKWDTALADPIRLLSQDAVVDSLRSATLADSLRSGLADSLRRTLPPDSLRIPPDSTGN